MKRIALTFLLLLTLIASSPVDAQSLQPLGGAQENISIRTVPPRPGPNQNITVIIESFAMSLDRATITWVLNGKIEAEKIGQKTFSFRTGETGSVSEILIIITSPEGAITRQTLIIRPATVDIITEALSYTPPFYKGKALYPFQGTVKVVAIPNIITSSGNTLDQNKLVYSWKVDGNPATGASGYGKNFINFTGTIPLKPATVSVEVASLDGEYVAEGSTVLSPVQPQTVFYEESPLMGIMYNKALSGNLSLKNEEIRIVAIPYFSGVKERESGGLKYEWRMNSNLIDGTSSRSGISFRQENRIQGATTVSLQISNPVKIFQFSDTALSLFFGGSEGN